MSKRRRYFWNTSENRLRAGWRLTLQLALNIGGFKVFIELLVPYALRNHWPRPVVEAVGYSAALGITLLSVWFAGHFLDRRVWRPDFGFVLTNRVWWADFGVGLAVGAGLVTVVMLAATALGLIQLDLTFTSGVTDLAFPAALLLSLIGYGAVGFFEELARAYQIRNLFEGLGHTRLGLRGGAVLATSGAALISVVMHSSGMPPFILFVFVSMAIQGLFFLFTGRVALITGYHVAWDFTLAAIFGIEALTQTETTSVFTPQLTGLTQVGETGASVASFLPLVLMGLLSVVLQGVAWLLLLGWVRWRTGRVRVRAEMARPTLLC